MAKVTELEETRMEAFIFAIFKPRIEEVPGYTIQRYVNEWVWRFGGEKALDIITSDVIREIKRSEVYYPIFKPFRYEQKKKMVRTALTELKLINPE